MGGKGDTCLFYIPMLIKQYNFFKLAEQVRCTLAFKTLVFAFPFKWAFAGENVTGSSMDTAPGLNTALCSLKFLLGYRHMGQCLFSWLI